MKLYSLTCVTPCAGFFVPPADHLSVFFGVIVSRGDRDQITKLEMNLADQRTVASGILGDSYNNEHEQKLTECTRMALCHL